MNLKSQSHHLKPIILIGKKGLTESVLKEIDAALLAHELIKIKFQESALELMENTEWILPLKARLINTRGHILTIYRKNPEP